MFKGHKKDYTKVDIYQYRHYPAYHQQLLEWYDQENSTMIRATLRVVDKISQEWALLRELPKHQGTAIVEKMYHRQYTYNKEKLFAKFWKSTAQKLNYINNALYSESIRKLYEPYKSPEEKKAHTLRNMKRRKRHELIALSLYIHLESTNPEHPLLVVGNMSVLDRICNSITNLTRRIAKLESNLYSSLTF